MQEISRPGVVYEKAEWSRTSVTYVLARVEGLVVVDPVASGQDVDKSQVMHSSMLGNQHDEVPAPLVDTTGHHPCLVRVEAESLECWYLCEALGARYLIEGAGVRDWQY